MNKKTILWSNEMSGLSTGYSTYGREVMKRLYATGKYHIYELGTYGYIIDSRFKFPWGYYGNMPNPSNESDISSYKSDPYNQFGKWRLNDVVLDCKPDILIDIRDNWMLTFEQDCAFRDKFDWLIMPTVDAEPQEDAWISDFANADAVCTYSNYGFEVLKKQGNGRIRLSSVAPPGIDTSVFKPVENKKNHRKNAGFSEDLFIIGTVMRNQPRKLYPDLMEAFSQYLNYCKNHGYIDLAKRSYLYIHTTYPDLGWDIPRFLKEYDIGHKTLFTYRCTSCGHVFPSYFQDSKVVCRMCGKKEASMPSVNLGVNEDALVQIYNLFDVYVQYANSEGFGMPQVEAAACGVPVFATDYSAMSDVVRKLKGFPINVQRFYHESATLCKRALPDNNDFVNKLVKFASNPIALQEKRRFDCRKAVESHYTWDKTAMIWEKLIDSMPPKNPERWNSPPSISNVPQDYPKGLDNESFINWCYHNVLQQPWKIGEYRYFKAIRDLNYEHTITSRGSTIFNEMSTFAIEQMWVNVTQEQCFKYFTTIRNSLNHWEAKRGGLVKEPTPEFIRMARKPYE